MKTLNTALVVPNVNRFQVVRAWFDPDAPTPHGEVELRFLMVGGNAYGPGGTTGTWTVPVIDAAGGGSIGRNATPTGVGDMLITQPNPNTGVFTACWNAWRGAANTKTARNNALEAIIDTPAVGILSAELAGT